MRTVRVMVLALLAAALLSGITLTAMAKAAAPGAWLTPVLLGAGVLGVATYARRPWTWLAAVCLDVDNKYKAA